MAEDGWSIVDEITAGDIWAAVVEHPPVAMLDRMHAAPCTTLGYWMSAGRNGSRGRFVVPGGKGGHARLGRIVVVPANLPLHVRSDALPARRMLHCRLPGPANGPLPADDRLLALCRDVRDPVIARSLAEMAREVTAPTFGSRATIEGLGLAIVGAFDRALSASTLPRRGGLAPWQLQRINDHLHAGHWDSSVSDLAALCGISPGHCMRAFRQSTGRSIAAHIADLRFDQARALLALDRRSIGEVAAALRFSGSSAFSAAFRRETGLTPNGFRAARSQSSSAALRPAWRPKKVQSARLMPEL